jgi:hypothetical protein
MIWLTRVLATLRVARIPLIPDGVVAPRGTEKRVPLVGPPLVGAGSGRSGG